MPAVTGEGLGVGEPPWGGLVGHQEGRAGRLGVGGAFARVRPALAIPRRVGEPEEVARAAGSHSHDQLVAESSPQSGVEGSGHADISSDASRLTRMRGLGRVGAAFGQASGHLEREVGRKRARKRDHLGGPRRWQHGVEEERDGEHEDRGTDEGARGQPPASPRHRSPGACQRDHRGRQPHCDPDEKPARYRLSRRHRYERPGCCQGEQQVAPGRNVESVHDLDPGEQRRQRHLNCAQLPGMGRAEHLVHELHEDGDDGYGENDLHPLPGLLSLQS